MPIIRYDPLSQVGSLLRWPSLLDEDFGNSSQSLDVYETDKSITVAANVAGVEPSKVKVTFHKGILTITGEVASEEKDKKYYQKSYHNYYYKVAVPGEINLNAEPKAKFKNGLVEIVFDKVPEEQPKEIVVKAG